MASGRLESNADEKSTIERRLLTIIQTYVSQRLVASDRIDVLDAVVDVKVVT